MQVPITMKKKKGRGNDFSLKISKDHNGHSADSMSSKTNPHPACSQPSMSSFQVPHERKQPTFEEIQEQLRED